MSLMENIGIVEKMIQFSDLKVGDAFWVGRQKGEKHLPMQIDGQNNDGSFAVFFLNNSGRYGDLLQEPEEGAIYFRSETDVLSKPLYIVEMIE